MAVTLVQSNLLHSTGVTTTYTGTLTSTVAVGNFLVVTAGGQVGGPAASTATFSDNQSNTYTPVIFLATGGCGVFLGAAANVAGGSYTGTVVWDQVQVHNNFFIQEWSGMPSTVQVDATSGSFGNNSGIGMSCGTLITTNATDLLIAAVISNANTPEHFTAPSGYTIDTTFTTAIGGAIAYQLASATGSGVVTYTSTDNTGQWAGVVAGLKYSGTAAVGGVVANNPVWF